MNDKLKRVSIKYVFMLFPFFEPYSVDMLSSTSAIWKAVDIAMALSRYLISMFVIGEYLIRRKKPHSRVGAMCLAFILVRIISSIINHSIYISYLLSILTYCGFILLLEEMIHGKNPQQVFAVFARLFAFFCFFAVITTVLLPNGFNHAADKAEAIYFLGSKNSSFYYYYMFLTAWIILLILQKRLLRIPTTLTTLLFFGVFLIMSYIYRSSNSLGSLFILMLFYLLVRFSHLLYKLAKPQYILIAIVLIVVLIMFKNSIPLFNTVFAMLGRDSSMTGRDFIWAQQFELVKQNPIWGNGIIVETILSSNAIATHAHNFYLDTVVKYGFASLTVLVILIVTALGRLRSMRTSKFKIFLAGAIFTLLLHSLFDDVSLYLLFAILMFTEYRNTISIGNMRLKL